MNRSGLRSSRLARKRTVCVAVAVMSRPAITAQLTVHATGSWVTVPLPSSRLYS